MVGRPFLVLLEAWLVQRLLQTPAFHRAVEKVAKGVHRLRHGIPPEEMGGTKIDDHHRVGEHGRNFFQETNSSSKPTESEIGNIIDPESSDIAWKNAQHRSTQAPKRSLFGEFTEVFREQMQNGKPKD